MNAKVITIWGSNGSGKTTTAVNFASMLAQRNLTVCLISSNMYYGELQAMLGCNISEERGLYHALMNGETKNMFVQAGKTSVFALSVPDNFDAMKLSTVSGESVYEMLNDAALRFDYIVIDGGAELNNAITGIGLVEADVIFTVHRPSVKDCLWQRSMNNIYDLLNLKYKTVHILNGYDKSCDLREYMISSSVDFEHELEYVSQANIYANMGRPIIFRSGKAERNYADTISRMVSSVII